MSWEAIAEQKELSDETFTSKQVHLEDNKVDHGLEIIVAGSGTVAITPYTSISGKDWISNGGILDSFGATSGPGSDGKQIVSLLLRPSEFVRFSVVVTGDATVSLWFTQK